MGCGSTRGRGVVIDVSGHRLRFAVLVKIEFGTEIYSSSLHFPSFFVVFLVEFFSTFAFFLFFFFGVFIDQTKRCKWQPVKVSLLSSVYKQIYHSLFSP